MDPRWLTSEPIERKPTWKPKPRPVLIPWTSPVGTGQGDSDYGPFDPPGYRETAFPTVLNEDDEQERLRAQASSGAPWMQPQSQPPDPIEAIAPEPQDDRGWPGQISDAAQGWSRGLAQGLEQAPQAISGALQAANESPIFPTNWGPIKRAGEAGAETLLREGSQVASKFGQAAQDFATDPLLERNLASRQQEGQPPPRRQSFVEPALESVGVIPKTVGAVANTFSGKPLTSPEGKPMGAGDVLEPFVDPLPGAGLALGAVTRVGSKVLPDLATHSNPAVRAVHAMFQDPDPEMVPRGWVEKGEDARRWLVQQFTDSGIHLSKAQQMARDVLDNGQLPDNLRPADLQRMMPDPAAEQRVNDDLKPIAREVAGPLYNWLAHILNDSDNVDKAREVGLRARNDVMKTRGEFKLPEELNVDRKRAGAEIERLEGLLDDAFADPHPSSVERADKIGLELNKAQDRFNALNKRAQEMEVAFEQRIRHDAAAAQYDAEFGRVFPGGVNVADSEGALQSLQQNMGPELWDQMQGVAQRVWNYADGLRQTLVDAGVWSAERAAYFREHFPHYIPTNILEHLDAGPSPFPKGKGLSVTDDLVDRLSIEGTEKAREDPLAALARSTYATERTAARNRTFNAFIGVRNTVPQLRELIPEILPAGVDDLRRVADEARQGLLEANPAATAEELAAAAKNARGALLSLHRSAMSKLNNKDYVALQGFENGVKKTYAMPKAMAEAIQGSSYGGSNAVSRAIQHLNRFFTMAATTRNPAFLIGNAVLDATAYDIKESARSGWGPLAAPGAMVDLAKSYYDLLRPGSGISRGEFTGEAAEMLRGGAGQFGIYSGTRKARQETIRSIQRDKFWEIKDKEDIGRLVKDFATLKWIEAAGGRVEMAPRLAAYRRAKRRGLSPLDAKLAARDVTIDFARGGEFAKLLNLWLPFFNVGIQGAVTPFRTFSQNKWGTTATALGLIGVPTYLTERWNRGWNPDGTFDHQRGKDYADVPDYAKQQGMVFMLPNNAPVNAEGVRKPEYLYMRLREWAWAAIAARQAVDASQGQARPWQSVAGDLAAQSVPVTSPSEFIPWPVGVPTQLASDRDWFGQRQIATEQNDQEASNLGRLGAQVLTPVAQGLSGDPFAKIRPSQVDFAVRGIGAGLGSFAMGASNLVNPPADPRAAGITSAPVVGGIANRFVGNRTGQRVFETVQHPLPVDMLRTLADVGIDTKPAAPPDVMTIPGFPTSETKLKPEQREEYNRIFQVIFNSLYQNMPPESRTDKAALADMLSETRQQTTTAFPLGLTPQQIRDQTTFDGKPPNEQQKLAIELAADLRDPQRFPEYVNPQTGEAEGGPEEWSVWDQALKTKTFNGQPLTEAQIFGLRDRKREALTRRNLQLYELEVSPQGAVTGINVRDPRYDAWNRYFGTFQGIDDTYLQAWKDGRRARYVNPQTGEQVSPAQSDLMDRWLRMYRDSRVGSKLRAALRPKALSIQKWATADWKNQLRMVDEAELQEEAGVTDLREQQFAGTVP